MGRPARQTTAPVSWSVRGIEADTQRVIEKAAERVGKTPGQYINEDVRGFAQRGVFAVSYKIRHLTNLFESAAFRSQDSKSHTFLNYRQLAIQMREIIQKTGS
ncbi:hypothetical protein [Spirosoma jeollabukense]